MLNPGFLLHVAARKACISELGKEAIEQGCRQIIVIGAGYDTFAVRAAMADPALRCFEIDHPATQAIKRLALGAVLPPNLSFVPAELSRESLSEVLLRQTTFSTSTGTLVVIEGVLMYLAPDAVRRLFLTLTELISAPLVCIFTFMNRKNGQMQFYSAHPLVNWWLKQKQEEFRWGIEAERLPDFLREFGLTASKLYGRQEFMALLGPQLQPILADGELVSMAVK